MRFQTKPVILAMMRERHPAFQLVRTAGNRIFFRRDGGDHPHAYVVFQREPSQDVYVDLAVTYEPKWEGGVPGLGTWESLAVVSGKNPTRLGQLMWYHYGPTKQAAARTFDLIGQDIQVHAIPWFEQQALKLRNDHVLQAGLRQVRSQGPLDDTELRILDEARWNQGGLAGLRHPRVDSLVAHLKEQAATNAPEDRVRYLAFALLWAQIPRASRHAGA